MTGAVHRDVAPGFRAHRDFKVAAGPQLMENHLVVGIVPETVAVAWIPSFRNPPTTRLALSRLVCFFLASIFVPPVSHR
jgi:hypothetical protein